MPPLVNRPERRRKYSYNVRLIRRDLSHTIQDIAELFGLHPNAVRRWIKAGLHTIDDHRPQLIHGSDLIDFLKKRQQGRKQCCGPGEMYCCRCRAPRRPTPRSVVVDRHNAGQLMIRGDCDLCGTRMNRSGSVAQLAEVERAFAVTTAPARLGETAEALAMCDLQEGT